MSEARNVEAPDSLVPQVRATSGDEQVRAPSPQGEQTGASLETKVRLGHSATQVESGERKR